MSALIWQLHSLPYKFKSCPVFHYKSTEVFPDASVYKNLTGIMQNSLLSMKPICSWCSHEVLFLIFLLNIAMKLWNFCFAEFSHLEVFFFIIKSPPMFHFGLIICGPALMLVCLEFKSFLVIQFLSSMPFHHVTWAGHSGNLVSRMTEYRISWAVLTPLVDIMLFLPSKILTQKHS